MKTIQTTPSTSPTIGRDAGCSATFSAEMHPEQPLTFARFVVDQVAHGQPYHYEIQASVEDYGQVTLRLPAPPPFVSIVIVDAAGHQVYPAP